MFDKSEILQRVMYVVPLVLSLSVHEWAHAYSAYRLGDDTASRAGRLTLNPLAHIDPVGTLLLPLLGIPFGWAKPVPVNPTRFRRDISMRAGMMITAAAGPISNLVIALVCAVSFGLALRFGILHVQYRGVPIGGAEMLLRIAIQMNILLALFNLLPIPPLDGSRVVDGLVPYRLRPQWEVYARYGQFVLLGVIVFGQRLLATPMGYALDAVNWFVALVAGLG